MSPIFRIISITVLGVMISALLHAAAGMDAQHILSDIHYADQMEIQMGLLAKQKGSSGAVRSYGDQLVKDHTDSDIQVSVVSQKDSIALLPSKSKIKDMKAMSDLTDETAAQFDKDFLSLMVKDHQTAIRKFQNAEKTLPASDVRDLVAKTLPVLQKHLAQAEQLLKGL